MAESLPRASLLYLSFDYGPAMSLANGLRPFLLLPAAVVLFSLAGCGPSAPYPIVPVTGKVTYEDGTPIPAARVVVSFESEAPPVDSKTHPRAGKAEVNPSDGTFSSVTTWKFGDGAIVGPHKVVVISMDEKQNPTKHVPKEYQSKVTTPLTIEVTRDGKPLEIKVAKPKG